MSEKRYNDYPTALKKIFNQRIQKIAIDAGFTCPNRDGQKSVGGCIYCDNKTFNPFYCTPEKSITQQLNEGIAFFSKKYATQRYFAYFQAYTNTYAPLEILRQKYEEAFAHPLVEGLIIATRPDCITEPILDYIAELSQKHYIVVEYGVESFKNQTLEFINRHHTAEESISAIRQTLARNIKTGVHLILGLPTENKDNILQHARLLATLPPIYSLKLHQLQVIRATIQENIYNNTPDLFPHFTLEQYVDLVIDFIELLPPQIIIERFTSESPLNKVIFPQWGGKKNYEIVHIIDKRMIERNTQQGRLWKKITSDSQEF